MNHRSPSPKHTPANLRAAAGAPVGRAFTLIEMLIAVGAVGLIAVGLARLFSSTGQVVSAGRRISAMNELAATLENQIRRDIATMATQGEGFLVIRNKLLLANPLNGDPTGNPDNGIRLSADDRSFKPRPRRIDEFGFFSHGKFTSAREPLFPGRAPVGAAARIYYGHGMQQDTPDTPRLDADPIWSTPTYTWPAGLGRKQSSGQDSLNTYAGNWTLLRHVTVLARPQPSQFKRPASAVRFTDTNWKDSPIQIGLEPAMASIFRIDPRPGHTNSPDIKGYGYIRPTAPNNPTPVDDRLPIPQAADFARANDANLATNPWPSSASGIVDIASIDLAMIRARIVGLSTTPLGGLRSETFVGSQVTAAHMTLTGSGSPVDTAFTNPNYGQNIIHAQKMMMASALPGNDPWLIGPGGSVATPTSPVGGYNDTTAPAEQRMLCAASPPDFTGNLTNGSAWPATEPYRQQDQAMLSASNLAVGCTEFIVEWSFGDVYPASTGNTNAPTGTAGQIIWHGRKRDVPGSVDVLPYRGGTTYSGNSTPDGLLYRLPASVIHWPVDIPETGNALPWDNGTWPESQPVYSFFGYQIPIENLANPGTSDWPWPKLLRFTIGLTDPADPTFEQVVQFIVEVPSPKPLQ